MARKTWKLAACGVLAVTVLARAPAAGQTTGSKNPPLVISSMAGRDLFEFYCASCHGRDGKGTGPVASALKTPPSDLTAIAQRNGGQFPSKRVVDAIANDGARIAAHGSKEMPVWGPIFSGLDSNEAMNRMRFENMVKYLEAMQQR